MTRGSRLAGASALAVLVGCSSTLPVTRAYAPADVGALRGSKLAPVAVVHDRARTPIPADAHITATEVAWTPGGDYVHKIRPGDVIEADEDGTILGVRNAAGVETRFVRGTASSPPGTDFVRGRLSEEKRTIALGSGDRIEASGVLEDGDKVPASGNEPAATVVEDRSLALLVAGTLGVAIGYGPALFVGISSSQSYDRPLVAPVVGPWIALAVRPSCNLPQGDLPVDPCTGETLAKVGIVAMGVAQAAGAIAIAFGIPSDLVLVDEKGRRVALAPNANGAALVGYW
jgi:hypothetical protein